MNLTDRIDACITEMQAICNSNGDEDTVEEIAVATADELAACRDVAKKLLAACKVAERDLAAYKSQVGDWNSCDEATLQACRDAIAEGGEAEPAIAKRQAADLLAAAARIIEAVDFLHESGKTLTLYVNEKLVRDLRNAVCDAKGGAA